MELVSQSDMVKLYVNGVLKSSKAGAGFQVFPDLYFGKDAAGNYFDGMIDEVAIYKGALRGAQVLKHYRDGLAGAGY